MNGDLFYRIEMAKEYIPNPSLNCRIMACVRNRDYLDSLAVILTNFIKTKRSNA